MLAFQEVDDSLLSLMGNFSLPFLVGGWEEESTCCSCTQVRLSGPADGLHNPLHERINKWNAGDIKSENWYYS